MTINEAIKVINPDDHGPEAAEILNGFNDLSEGVQEAHRVVIAALRTRQATTKLDRSKWKKCQACPSDLSVWWYCPFCGRPRINEAWAELERRMNSGTTDIF